MGMPPAIQPVHVDPPEMTEDMTRSDLLEVLEHLPLSRRRREEFCLVRIDLEVRNYLMRLLREGRRQ